MPLARLPLSAVTAAGLSLAFGSAPAQAQYADDPPYADRPPAAAYAAPDYAPPPAGVDHYGPPADGGYYPPPPAYAAPDVTVGEVIVVAPYRRRAERDPATGAPIERVSTSRRVRYDDLDLTSNWGVRALHYRILRAARDACDSLERHYDVSDAGDGDCVSDAVRNAMSQAPIGYASDAAYEGP